MLGTGGRLRRLGGAANDNRWVGAAVRRGLPDPVFRRVAAALGGRLPEPIDLAPLELVRTADHAALTEPAQLEHGVLPALGLSDDVPHVYPAALQHAVGRGLRHWQYPCQFAPYLAHVAAHGPVRRYLEVGVRHGGTFLITVEVLSRTAPVERAVAVDLDPVPALATYVPPAGTAIRAERMDSRSRRFRRLLLEEGPFDLVLVDGNHTYAAARSDVDAVLPHARMVALHDIVDDASPGVRRLWGELRERHADGFTFAEFTAQYDEVVAGMGRPVLGIGVMRRTA